MEIQLTPIQYTENTYTIPTSSNQQNHSDDSNSKK